LPDLTALPGNRGKRLGFNVNFLFSALMNRRTRGVQAMETIRLGANKASGNKPANQAGAKAAHESNQPRKAGFGPFNLQDVEA